MMKKIYVTPKMECETMENVQPLCTSGVTGLGMDFGGTDIDGSVDPDAKELNDDWFE